MFLKIRNRLIITAPYWSLQIFHRVYDYKILHIYIYIYTCIYGLFGP